MNTNDFARVQGTVRILFGLICLINLLLHLDPSYGNGFSASMNHAANAAGQPGWLSGWVAAVTAVIEAIGPKTAVGFMLVLEAILAASLLTGVGTGAFAWLGVAYNLFLWTTLGGLGGPYTLSPTDPGTAIVYALAFLVIWLTRAGDGLSLARRAVSGPPAGWRLRAGLLLFAALWGFDAYWKWHPAFLGHAEGFLVAAQAGQPAWISAWISLLIDTIRVVGASRFGFIVALTESFIALGLLLGVWRRGAWLAWTLWGGFLYSILLWSSAEGLGGPYGAGFTGNRGDVLGTANIYAMIFVMLWTAARRESMHRA